MAKKVGTKTNRITVYLLKAGLVNIDDIANPETARYPIEGVGTFVYSDSHQFRPDWIKSFFGATLPEETPLFSSIARGTLLVPIKQGTETRYFAVSFGGGRFLLKEGAIEERFGLKVVLNSIKAESLRSIDKTTLGAVPKQTREQMAREVPASEFGIDIEQDLISSVTAKSNDELLGKTVTGRDALTVSAKIDITNVVDFLKHCYARYESPDYKTEFGWIDQISEIKSKDVVTQLDALLVNRLQTGQLEKVWMSVPEVINWEDLKGFRYCRQVKADLHDDLSMRSYLDEREQPPNSIEEMKHDYVYMISQTTQVAIDHWSAYKCTYAEIDHNGELYVLNNGRWYQIENNFCDYIIKNYKAVAASAVPLPECQHSDEGSYNVAAAAALNAHLMDQDLIPHGGTHGKVEVCDILMPDKKFVHVKRYGGSAPLSHLFFQGIISGELFARDADFRKKVNDKVPVAYKLADPAVRPPVQEYEVVYGIISQKVEPLDLPFFSKVSLKNARERLEGLGFKVRLNKIYMPKPAAADGAAPAEAA